MLYLQVPGTYYIKYQPVRVQVVILVTVPGINDSMSTVVGNTATMQPENKATATTGTLRNK